MPYDPISPYNAFYQQGIDNPAGSVVQAYQNAQTIQLNRQKNQLDNMKYLAEQQKQMSIQSQINNLEANPSDYSSYRRLAGLSPETAKSLMDIQSTQNTAKTSALSAYQRTNAANKPKAYEALRTSYLPSIGVDTSAWPTEYGDLANQAIEEELGRSRSTKDILDEEGAKLKNDELVSRIRNEAITGRLNEQKIITEQTKQIKNLQEKQGAASEKSSNLRKELNERLNNFIDVRNAYDNITASAQNPTPAGDMSLIFAYMKLLDPGSTVREGEYAAVENARGTPETIRNLYNKIVEGKLLTPKQRTDFANRADSLYKVAEKNANKTIKQYEGIAKRAGLNPEDIVIDFSSTTPIQVQGVNKVPFTIKKK